VPIIAHLAYYGHIVKAWLNLSKHKVGFAYHKFKYKAGPLAVINRYATWPLLDLA